MSKKSRLPKERVIVEFVGIPKSRSKKKVEEPEEQFNVFGDEFNFGMNIDFEPKGRIASNETEFSDIATGVVKPAKKQTKKKQKFDNSTLETKSEDVYKTYEARYKPALDLLDGYDAELDEFLDSRKAKLNEYENSRMKGGINASSLITGSITALLSTKLGSIKERVAITGKISDFELKKAKENSASKNGMSDDKIVQQIFTKLNDNDNVSETMSLHDQFISGGFDESADAILSQRVNQLEENGDINFTQAEEAFKYAGMDIEILVLLQTGTSEWRFAAIDKLSGNELTDYPVPDKHIVAGEGGTKMKFMNDNTCKDLLNRTYTFYDVDEL